MVRKPVKTRNKRVEKTREYIIYSGGIKIGMGVFTPSKVKDLERAGYTVRLHGKFGLPKKTNPRKKPNPRGLVKIYQSITRIEGTKGKDSRYPGQKFYHNFKRPYPSMYGTMDRKVLVIK